MKKPIKPPGMKLTKAQHEKWHQDHPGSPPKISRAEHTAFLRKMGISEKQDRQWHEAMGDAAPADSPLSKVARPINLFVVGGGFIRYCVVCGWLVQVGAGRNAKYYATEKGRHELPSFGIQV